MQLIHAQSENTVLQVHLQNKVELQELIILIRKRLQHLIVLVVILEAIAQRMDYQQLQDNARLGISAL